MLQLKNVHYKDARGGGKLHGGVPPRLSFSLTLARVYEVSVLKKRKGISSLFCHSTTRAIYSRSIQ